tara:strand:- start:465 stop:1334 length:870 start_codon:yes stop_codon:yes gene_type:complete
MKIEAWPMHGPLNSKNIFAKLIQSMQKTGDNVSVNKEIDGDVAVIWSVLWQGRMRNYKQIWQRYRQANKPVIVLEVGGMRRNKSFKIAINGVNRKADFANQDVDNTRWPLFNHTLKPWKQTGNKILILGQHDASEQWNGMPSMNIWFEQQINEIRKYTDRPIQVRPHPRNPIGFDYKKYKDVSLVRPVMDRNTVDDTNFKDTLKDAWAVVNHSSNPAMEAVINGIPVFVSADSLCYDVGNHSLSDINNPKMPDRREWTEKLSYTEWFEDEIENGSPWQRIRNRISKHYL